MKVLFVAGQTPISKAIMAATGEPVSHCALLAGDSTIIHSNFLGVGLQPLDKFLKTHDVVYTVEVPDNWNSLITLLGKYDRSMYDFGALLFIAASVLCNKYLKIPMPKHNLWAMGGMFLCTEWVSQDVLSTKDDMITPYQLYKELCAIYPLK